MIPITVKVAKDYDNNGQIHAAALTNNALPGMALEDRCVFERERSFHRLFAVFLNALLNKLVRAVDAFASRAGHLTRESIRNLYVKICLNSGSFFCRNRMKVCDLGAFRCAVPSPEDLRELGVV